MRKTIFILFPLLFLVFMPALQSAGLCAEPEGREKAEALLKEADALFSEGKMDKAVETVREAVKVDPAHPDAYDQLGHMLMKAGKLDEAIGAFDSALKINPRSRTAKTGKGLALLKKGDAKGAEAVLKEALTLNPYPSATHYALGLVYEQTGDYAKAIFHFKEGIRTFKSGKK
ncbi:MAG TPA: tetratricopeptide repeat protein [Dissulfurispiraceae bacterium]